MKVVIGLDVGTSTTKIVAMEENRKIVYAQRVTASEQLTSLFGAVGSMLYHAGLSLEQVDRFMITGVGASFLEGEILGAPTGRVPEIEAMGEGGLFLAKQEKAVIVSIGTGMTLVNASLGDVNHVGGLAFGGGTLAGLSARLFGTDRFDHLYELACAGDACKVDKSMREISHDLVSNLPDYATASNLGKLRGDSREEDIAAGLFNMLYQTAGTMAVFAARNYNTDTIVAVGSLSTTELARLYLCQVGDLYGYRFVIPEHAEYATAVGAAIRAFRD